MNLENKVIIFSTDTVYGIGCSIYSKEAQDRIYKIKNRDRSKPLAVLCADLDQIKSICYVDSTATTLINNFLPGQVTFILKAKEHITNIIGLETIGVRIPNHKLALNILKKYGPLTTTSVNESGEVPLNNYNEIKEIYLDKVDYIYESKEPSSNVSSTVISLVNDFKILREGYITKQDILKCLDDTKNIK